MTKTLTGTIESAKNSKGDKSKVNKLLKNKKTKICN